MLSWQQSEVNQLIGRSADYFPPLCAGSCFVEFSGLLSAEANKGGELLLSHLKPKGMLEKSGSVYLASNGSNIVSLRMFSEVMVLHAYK